MSTWVNTLRELAEDHFEKTGKALLLSKVTGLLKRSYDLDRVFAGRKSKAAIEAEASEVVQVVADTSRPLIWGILPKEVCVDANETSDFFGAPAGRSGDIPQYIRAVWSAFIRPIAPGHKRYLTVGASCRFEDIPDSYAPPADVVEISADDLVAKDTRGTPEFRDAVHAAIVKWAHEHRIDVADLHFTESRRNRDWREDWVARFQELSLDDLKRISVPMDIVVKLLKEKTD